MRVEEKLRAAQRSGDLIAERRALILSGQIVRNETGACPSCRSLYSWPRRVIHICPKCAAHLACVCWRCVSNDNNCWWR